MDQKTVLDILENTNSTKDQKIDALLYAVFSLDDWKWLQNLCMQMADSDDEDVSGVAITGIGHIARIYRKLDVDIVVPFLENIVKEDNHLSGRATDALDDIEIFMNKRQ